MQLRLFDNAACADLQITMKDRTGYLAKPLLQARSRRCFCKKVSFESIVVNLKCACDLHCRDGCWMNFKNGIYRSVQYTFVVEECMRDKPKECLHKRLGPGVPLTPLCLKK